jgi:hypothetical protein
MTQSTVKLLYKTSKFIYVQYTELNLAVANHRVIGNNYTLPKRDAQKNNEKFIQSVEYTL